MLPNQGNEASPPSLAEQVKLLERERDQAKAEAEFLKKELEHARNIISAKNKQMINSGQDWQKRQDALHSYLSVVNTQLSLTAQELEQVKSAKLVTQVDSKSLVNTTKGVKDSKSPFQPPLSSKSTEDAIAGVKKFLDTHKNITRDGFFGMGQELDELRSLVKEVPREDKKMMEKESKLDRFTGHVFKFLDELEAEKGAGVENTDANGRVDEERPEKRVKFWGEGESGL